MEQPFHSNSAPANAGTGGPASWNTRLALALAAYGVLATLAGLTLEGVLRGAVWGLLAALALKTWIAWLRGRQDR